MHHLKCYTPAYVTCMSVLYWLHLILGSKNAGVSSPVLLGLANRLGLAHTPGSNLYSNWTCSRSFTFNLSHRKWVPQPLSHSSTIYRGYTNLSCRRDEERAGPRIANSLVIRHSHGMQVQIPDLDQAKHVYALSSSYLEKATSVLAILACLPLSTQLITTGIAHESRAQAEGGAQDLSGRGEGEESDSWSIQHLKPTACQQ